MLNNIRLYGHLAKKYGANHRFDVASPGEAARALAANFKTFYNDFKDGSYRVIIGDKDTGVEIDATGVNFYAGGKDIHIIPILSGSRSSSKNGGIIKQVIGVVLIVAAAATFIISGGTLAGPALSLAKAGFFFVAAGTAVLLSQPPRQGSFDSVESPDARSSFVFNGPSNKSKQGAPVPLVYGRIRTGSVLVSAGITVEQLL